MTTYYVAKLSLLLILKSSLAILLEVIHALRSQEFAQLEVLWKHYAYVHFHDRRIYAECMGTINCQLQLYADCGMPGG